MKKEISNVNKAIIAMCFTFAIYVLLKFYNDVYWVNLFGGYIYVILGFLLPVILLKGNIRLIEFDKASVSTKFVIYSAISIGIIVEVISYYITPSYYQILSKNILFQTFFPFNVLVELAIACLFFMYFSKISELFSTEVRRTYCYLFCVIIFTATTNQPIKNTILGIIAFYIMHYIENSNHAIVFLLISVCVSVLFRYMCYFYINFGIEHYFIFLFIIIAFIIFEKALKFAERMLLRKEFERVVLYKPNKIEGTIFWILIIFVGLYLVIY